MELLILRNSHLKITILHFNSDRNSKLISDAFQ